MKKTKIAAALLSLLCAAALTACGAETIDSGSELETVAATNTTASDETTATTAAESETTAVTEKAAETTEAAATDTTAAESSEADTTAAENTTTAAEEQTTEAPAQQTEAPATEAPKEEKHLFDELKIGGASADYRAAHTNFNKRESDSCLSGRMYEYTYPDFVVLANEDNGVEKIESIKLTGPGVSTREGIHVDSTLEEVMKAYGEETSVNYFCKTTADGKLEIYVEHGIVMEIELTAA